MVDDIDIYDYELYGFREQIGVVLQDVFLFQRSIFENLTLGNDKISARQVINAAKEIEVHDFIEKLPNSYHFIINERKGLYFLGAETIIIFLKGLPHQS